MMRTLFAAIALHLVCACGSVAAPSAPRPPRASVAMPGLRTPEGLYAEIFAVRPRRSTELFVPSFANQVPVWQIDRLAASLLRDLGAWRGVERAGDGYVLRFDRGTVPSRLRRTPDGRVDLLWFGAPRTGPPPSLQRAVARFAALAGSAQFVDRRGRASACGHRAGCAPRGRLELQARRSGRAGARDVRRAPSCSRRAPDRCRAACSKDWPDGAPVTLHTLATLMVPHSDNTAADALLELLDRAALEREWPRNVPFLWTRQAFVLTALPHAALLARDVTGSLSERRALLRDLAALALPTPAEIETDRARALAQVGWWFSRRELCTLMTRLHELDALRARSVAPLPEGWDRVAYKGGRAPGLHQQTFWLARGRREVCVSATWNGRDDARTRGLRRGRRDGARRAGGRADVAWLSAGERSERAQR